MEIREIFRSPQLTIRRSTTTRSDNINGVILSGSDLSGVIDNGLTAGDKACLEANWSIGRYWCLAYVCVSTSNWRPFVIRAQQAATGASWQIVAAHRGVSPAYAIHHTHRTVVKPCSASTSRTLVSWTITNKDKAKAIFGRNNSYRPFSARHRHKCNSITRDVMLGYSIIDWLCCAACVNQLVIGGHFVTRAQQAATGASWYIEASLPHTQYAIWDVLTFTQLTAS